jgi:UDP-glucuronate 4-epimerase
MKVLVTGAAGFIGSHLAERLTREGHFVTGLDSLDPYYSVEFKKHTLETLTALGVNMQVGDLTKEDLNPILRDIEAVFHVAAQPGNSATVSFNQYMQNNLVATQKLVEAAGSSSALKAFINISTSSVYGFYATSSEAAAPEPVSNYGVTKLAAEQLVLSQYRDKGFPACSLRLFSVYGERERPDKLYPKLIQAIAYDKPMPIFEGSENHQRSFTYVEDIINGFLAVLDRWENAQGEIFNIGTDQCITTGEGIKIVEEIMGKKVRKNLLPKRPGDQLATHANIDKARKLLSYNPVIAPPEGLQRTISWFQKEIEGRVNYSV